MGCYICLNQIQIQYTLHCHDSLVLLAPDTNPEQTRLLFELAEQCRADSAAMLPLHAVSPAIVVGGPERGLQDGAPYAPGDQASRRNMPSSKYNFSCWCLNHRNIYCIILLGKFSYLYSISNDWHKRWSFQSLLKRFTQPSDGGEQHSSESLPGAALRQHRTLLGLEPAGWPGGVQSARQ